MDYYERNETIDIFLKGIANVARENPNTDFKSSDINTWVYRRLNHIGVKPDQFNVDLRDKKMPNYHGLIRENNNCHPESAFSYWINSFRGSKTDVFVQDNWTYFCQFISKDRRAAKSDNHLKVYIPLDEAHIARGAQLIFQFLEDNNISHLSKIGKTIRFDDIVIRLTNEQDLDKLINFVTSNPYLMQGLLPPNPFAYNKDGIALAVDGNLSYNSTIAGLVCLYINNKMKTNALNSVNSDDFYKYVNDIATKEFISKESTELRDYFKIYDNKTLTNYEQVISLILRTHNPNFSYNHLKGHYESCIEYNNRIPREMIDRTDRTLLEAIDLMIKRFNNVDAIRNVEAYYLTGQAKYLTSNNNLRNRVVNSTFRSDLRAILEHEKLDFMEYARRVMHKYGYDPNRVVTKTNQMYN